MHYDGVCPQLVKCSSPSWSSARLLLLLLLRHQQLDPDFEHEVASSAYTATAIALHWKGIKAAYLLS
jgi:hypothetical protein